jgi:murein DD-endopeptidase MepM/ murein hydrolase activator NlpD
MELDGSDARHVSCYSSSIAESVFLMRHFWGRAKRIERLVLPVKVDSISPLDNTYLSERPGGRMHEGIDLFVPVGTPVVSATCGVVLFIGRDVLGGNVVKVLGDDNRIYYYAHLSRSQSPEPGGRVRRAQIIGFVGNSGNAMFTPPHLHFEILEVLWVIPLMTRSVNPYEELSHLLGGKNNQ